MGRKNDLAWPDDVRVGYEKLEQDSGSLLDQLIDSSYLRLLAYVTRPYKFT